MLRIRFGFLLLAIVAVLGWLGALLVPRWSQQGADEASRRLLEREADVLQASWRAEGAELQDRARQLASELATVRFLAAASAPSEVARNGAAPSGPVRRGVEDQGAKARPDPQVLAQAALSSLPALPGEQLLLTDRAGQVLETRGKDGPARRGDMLGHLPLVREAMQALRQVQGLARVGGQTVRTVVSPVVDGATGSPLGAAVLLRPLDREAAASLANLVQGRPVVLAAEGSVLASSLPEAALAELRVQLVELTAQAKASFGLERRSRAIPVQLGPRARYELVLAELAQRDGDLSLLLLRPAPVFAPRGVLGPIFSTLLEHPADPLVVTLFGLGLVAFLLGCWLVASGVGAPCRRLVRDLQALGKAPQHHVMMLRSYPEFLKPVAQEAQIAVDVALQQVMPIGTPIPAQLLTPVPAPAAPQPEPAQRREPAAPAPPGPAPALATASPPAQAVQTAPPAVADPEPEPALQAVPASSPREPPRPAAAPDKAESAPEGIPAQVEPAPDTPPAAAVEQEQPPSAQDEPLPLVRTATPELGSLAEPLARKEPTAPFKPVTATDGAARAPSTRSAPPRAATAEPARTKGSTKPAASTGTAEKTARTRTPPENRRRRTPPRGSRKTTS